MNKKRITALFLALMMVLALPVQSFAQDVTDFTFQADIQNNASHECEAFSFRARWQSV